MTGRQPYDDLLDEEVETKYSQQIFPAMHAVHCQQVITACWRGDIDSAKEAMALIQAEMEKIQ